MCERDGHYNLLDILALAMFRIINEYTFVCLILISIFFVKLIFLFVREGMVVKF